MNVVLGKVASLVGAAVHRRDEHVQRKAQRDGEGDFGEAGSGLVKAEDGIEEFLEVLEHELGSTPWTGDQPRRKAKTVGVD